MSTNRNPAGPHSPRSRAVLRPAISRHAAEFSSVFRKRLGLELDSLVLLTSVMTFPPPRHRLEGGAVRV